MRARGIVGVMVGVGLVVGLFSFAPRSEGSDPEDEIGRMPPRLAYTDGEVSFWRPGDAEWESAEINTPLAPGDQLETGAPGNLELQIGERAFLRAGAGSRLSLEEHEPGLLRFAVAAGHVALDLRTLEAGSRLEVAAPNATFVLLHPGYYRLGVGRERTTFIARQSGRVPVRLAGGAAHQIEPNQEAVISDGAAVPVATYAAPPTDPWDRWNLARTDQQIESTSARYLSPGTYGASDLDRHGRWQVVEPYGRVWVPTAVPEGWAPYRTGSWARDPYFGWTWIDTAPWGWAPYHHGRWVFVNGYWGWAPGPVLARPVYAPALVAFFGGSGISVSVGGPLVGWVALGWGEPCVPWWGRADFRRPWWGGWGGPRIVNNIVVSRSTVVHAHEIRSYRNVPVRNAMVAVPEQGFGHRRARPVPLAHHEAGSLRPTHAAPRPAAAPARVQSAPPRASRPSIEAPRRSPSVTGPSTRGDAPGTVGRRSSAPTTPPAPQPRQTPAVQPRQAPPQHTAPAPVQPTARQTPAPAARPEVPRRVETPQVQTGGAAARPAPGRVGERTPARMDRTKARPQAGPQQGASEARKAPGRDAPDKGPGRDEKRK